MQKNCITPLLWAEKSPHATFKKTPIIMKSLFFAYADREREQDFGAYEYNHHANLREGDQR